MPSVVAPLSEERGNAWWLIAVYSMAWVYTTRLFMEHVFERKLFTYFMRQGYSEMAADKESAAIRGIRRLAKRRGPRIHKEREEYERLRQKFDSDRNTSR